MPPTDTMSHPEVLTHAPRQPNLRRLNLLFSIEDLGQNSFYPPLVILGLIGLTPASTSQLGAWILGACVAVIGLQMVLRFHHLAMPGSIRDMIARRTMFQNWMRHYADVSPRRTSSGRRSGHWITYAPYDILPKSLVLVCGIALPFTIGFTYVPAALCAAISLVSLGLALRNGSIIFLGTMFVSLSGLLISLG